jgi:hypothetical protein
MRRELEQIITTRIEPVLTGVQILELEAFLEEYTLVNQWEESRSRLYFLTNEKRAGADYNQ